MLFPKQISNWINGQECDSKSGELFEKINPATGESISQVARSRKEDVYEAVQAAKIAQPLWADTPPVQRGMILHKIVQSIQAEHKKVAEIVAIETGKSYKDAYAETAGAIALGLFYAGEGQRLFGRTTTSGVSHKYAMTVRQPVGIAGLIIAANTPIANIAWKIFPALICGNAAVLKAAEDAPATAWIVGRIAHEAGLPSGLLNIIQGYGEEAGAELVEHPDIDVISFTGSTAVGKYVQRAAAERLAKVSLELGGKNPLVICDDADLNNAIKWTLLSAFSNAGQRCSSGSRIIVFSNIYEQFKDMLLEHTKRLKVGSADDDFGPVINEKQLNNMIDVIERASQNGVKVLIGGHRLTDPDHKDGFYMAPTLVECVESDNEISTKELFGPIACLYRVKDFREALALANKSPYGLTACIHTKSIHRAIEFTQKVQAGVANVNAATYGSEPHMPFGGVKQSGNGWREPGTEALDVYSEIKQICINIDPKMV